MSSSKIKRLDFLSGTIINFEFTSREIRFLLVRANSGFNYTPLSKYIEY